MSTDSCEAQLIEAGHHPRLLAGRVVVLRLLASCLFALVSMTAGNVTSEPAYTHDGASRTP